MRLFNLFIHRYRKHITYLLSSPIILAYLLPTAHADDFRSFSLDLPKNVWALGVAKTLRTSVYLGESTEEDLLPIFAFKGQYGYILGPEAGIYLYNQHPWRVDLFSAYRFSGFDKHENSELEGMSADDSIDGGIKLRWSHEQLEAITSWRTDISDNHQGEEVQGLSKRRVNSTL